MDRTARPNSPTRPRSPSRPRIRLAATLCWLIVAGAIFVGTVTASVPVPTLPSIVQSDLPGLSASSAITVRASLSPGLPPDIVDVRGGYPRSAAAADARADRAAAAQGQGQGQVEAEVGPAVQAQVEAVPPPPAPKAAVAPTYIGSNHFWFPNLGISQGVHAFPCPRSEPPGEAVYRWGCAGDNNVYLMAHASGRFHPLNAAYYAGTLQPGLIVIYADAQSEVHSFKLDWYRVVAPAGDVGFAFAAQARSSLTLQTCVGANSELRLVVRFTEVPQP